LASYCWVASDGGTSIGRNASDVGVRASSSRVTEVVGACISIAAASSGVCASITSYSYHASIVGAGISIIASRRANALSSTRTKSFTLSTTRIAGNINASGNDEVVYDSRKLREIRNVNESCLDSSNRRSNIIDFSSSSSSNSNSEDDDSSSFSSIDSNSVVVHVVFTIS